MKLFKPHRTPQSKMLLALSLGTAFGILPFTIYRAVQNDWYVAFLDLIVVIGMSIIFGYVYKTNNVKLASLVLILVALSANVLSFYMKGISQVYWIYPAMLSAYYIMSPKKGLLINFVMLSFYIPKLIFSLEIVNVSTILATIIITNMIAYVFASGLRNQEVKLKKLASEDYLTGTGNRRALSEKLELLNKSLKNHDKTATIVLLDLDHFKKVNDIHGHMKGDEVLIRLAELLKCFYQNNENIFRYGGEEFLILCPGTSVEQGFNQAQKIRQIVKENIVIENNEQTISLGVAEYIKEESNDEWIRRVDLALYQAKNEGRDRVIKA